MNLLNAEVIKLLPWLLLLPLFSALNAFLLKRLAVLREILILLCAGIFLIILFLVIRNYDTRATPLVVVQFSQNLSLSFLAEPLGIIFLIIIGVLWFLANLYSFGYLSINNDWDQSKFFGFLGVSIFATVGIALSANLFTLFGFYELLTLVTYPLVTYYGSKKSYSAGKNYMTYLFITSNFLLLPVLVILHEHNSELIFNYNNFFLSLPKKSIIGFLIICLIYGTAKTAIFPLHGWLPQAMVAPTPVSALLHAVTVVKAGIFTLAKIFVYVFGIETITDLLGGTLLNANLFTYLAAISVIYAAIKASHKDNLKEMLAYSTIAQLSNCLLALSISTQAAVIACLLHVLAHAFTKITLFFGAGIIYILYGKTNISECKLIYKQNKLLTITYGIAGLSLIGLPPFLGFWSKYYIIMSALENNNWLVIFTLLASTILTATYIIPVFYKFFWEDEESQFESKSISLKNTIYLYLPLLITAIICVLGMIMIPWVIGFLEANIN